MRGLVISIALARLGLGGCGHSPSQSDRWLTERGRESSTWHTCVRIGATLRDACGSNATCASDVTTELTRRCYAGRYREATRHAKPDDHVRPEQLSPCFWDRDTTRGSRATNADSDPAAYAHRTCRNLVDVRLQPACVAELRDVIERLCMLGSTELTGAGP